MNEKKRDRVWKFALASTLRSENRVTPADIAEMAEVSERTAREALVVIAETGWISRQTQEDGTVIYEAVEWVDHDDEKWEDQ